MPKITLLLAVFLLAIALFLTACSSKQPTEIETNTSILTQQREYLITWHSTPETIPLNEYFELHIRIDKSQHSIDDLVELSLDAGMKQHNHGMHTRPLIERLSNNQFIVKGMLFHMRGEWQIQLTASQGAVKDSAEIKIVL